MQLERIILATVMIATAPVWTYARQAGQSPSVTLVRAASGTDGSDVAGEFRFREERRTFSRASDRQVIVWFSWRGVVGNHKLAGRWRAPNGATQTSEFDYTARNALFGAYWTLTLSSATPVGNWIIEATVDGLPGGSFSFDVTDSAVTATEPSNTDARNDPAPASSGKFPLGRSEMYERLSAHFGYIDRPPSRFGERLGAAATWVMPGQLVTALASVDEADALTLRTPQGTIQPLTEVLGWDAVEGWALLARTSGSGLRVADPTTVKVGDPCYAMDGAADGTRVLAECTIAGRNDSIRRGNPLVVSFLTGRALPGAAVVDQYGDVIGLVGAGAAPMTIAELRQNGAGVRGLALLPVPAATTSTSAPVSLSELRRRGVLVAPVTGEQHLRIAGFSAQGRNSSTRDYREAFTNSDKQIFVIITWEPRDRIRGNLLLRLYSQTNQVVSESKPKKVDFRPNRDSGSSSEFSMPVPAGAGRYRADLVLDDTIMWRGSFEVK
jgi:hypothetical protein